MIYMLAQLIVQMNDKVLILYIFVLFAKGVLELPLEFKPMNQSLTRTKVCGNPVRCSTLGCGVAKESPNWTKFPKKTKISTFKI